MQRLSNVLDVALRGALAGQPTACSMLHLEKAIKYLLILLQKQLDIGMLHPRRTIIWVYYTKTSSCVVKMMLSIAPKRSYEVICVIRNRRAKEREIPQTSEKYHD